jgi:hypothetical protein
MAKTANELFDMFAARVAEILRERHGLDPEPLLRTTRESFTVEGLIRRSDGSSEWHGVQATPEQLEWNGPNATAEAFVEEYMTAFRAAKDT